MSAALIILSVVTLARAITPAAIGIVAIASKNDKRRATAMRVLKILTGRADRRCVCPQEVTVTRKGTS